MSTWRRILAAATVVGGGLIAQGGEAHASAPAFLLLGHLDCYDVLHVSLKPHLPSPQHDVIIESAYVVRDDDRDEATFLREYPIVIDGLEVGRQFTLTNDQQIDGTSTSLVGSPLLGSPGLTVYVEFTHTSQQYHTLWGWHPVTYPEHAGFEITQEDCPAAPVVTEPPVVTEAPVVAEPPVTEAPVTTRPVDTTPVSTTAPTTSTLPTYRVPAVAVQNAAAPARFTDENIVALSPQTPAAQTLPATGGSNLAPLAGAAGALTLGLAMVGATRRR